MKATAGAALPPAMQGNKQKRRSDRHKKQDRRSKARKIFHDANDPGEFRTAVWVDALEEVDPSAAAPEDDEEYDELEDLQDDNKKRKRPPRKGKMQQKPGVMPKRFLPRSLGTILLEEVNRGEDGAARAFLAAEARVPADQQMPRRKFCPVTGTLGVYTEPKSNIPYSSLRALEQIRERSPPWMTLGGAAAYYEAVKSIEDA